jgi:hypothetical protein
LLWLENAQLHIETWRALQASVRTDADVDAALRTAKEICKNVGWGEGSMEEILNEISTIILRNATRADLPRATADDSCWHCGVILAGVSKPRCESCPDECDVEDCDALGCATPRATADNGPDDWCDDCQAYSHLPFCPAYRTRDDPLVDQLVDAVYRSMQKYDDGTWLLDNIKAKVRVKRILDATPRATGETTVEKVERQALAAELLGHLDRITSTTAAFHLVKNLCKIELGQEPDSLGMKVD